MKVSAETFEELVEKVRARAFSRLNARRERGLPITSNTVDRVVADEARRVCGDYFSTLSN
jgi:N12 class adenine-specific DNA methylase